METMLVGVTFVSLGLATCLAALAWKLMRDHRRFAAARVDALLALASAVESPDIIAPRTAESAPRPAAIDSPVDVLGEAPLPHDPSVSPAYVVAPAGGGRRRLPLALAMAGIVLATGVATVYAVRTSGRGFLSAVLRAASISDAATTVRPLELRSLTHELDDNGFFVVSGVVADPAGGRTFEGVVAVVYLYDEQGRSFANGRAPIELTTLGAGAASTFEVHVHAASPVARYRIGFRRPDGAAIAHVDKRQGPQGPGGQ